MEDAFLNQNLRMKSSGSTLREQKRQSRIDPAFALLKLNIDLVFKHPSEL
jgi:hypothetical protein